MYAPVSGVPWSLPLCRCLLRGMRGEMCAAKGSLYALLALRDAKKSDVRSGVPLAPSGVPWSRSAGGFCVAGVGQCALPRGRMYAPVSLWRPLVSRRSSGGFCVAEMGQCALSRGRMYAPVSLWRPLVSAALPVAFAWQARGNVHCQGVGCTPRCPSGVPWSPPLCRWLSPGRRGAINLHGQGVGCTPRCPSGVPWSLPLCRWLLRGRRGTMCVAKGSDVRPVGFCVAGLGQCALPRGRMYAPVSLWRPLVSAALPVMYQLSSFRLSTCELIMVCLCTWRSPPSLRVADVAHGDIYLGFAWQAWRL